MNKETIRTSLKNSPALKRMLDLLIMNQRDARPRWYIRLLAPLYQQRGRGSKIYGSVRMNTEKAGIRLRFAFTAVFCEIARLRFAFTAIFAKIYGYDLYFSQKKLEMQIIICIFAQNYAIWKLSIAKFISIT